MRVTRGRRESNEWGGCMGGLGEAIFAVGVWAILAPIIAVAVVLFLIVPSVICARYLARTLRRHRADPEAPISLREYALVGGSTLFLFGGACFIFILIV